MLTFTLDAAGGRSVFGYQADGLLRSVAQVDGAGQKIQTTFGYTAGKLTKTTTPDEQSRFFVYDALGNQVLSYSHWTNGLAEPDLVEKTIVQHTIYDANGRVTDSEQYTLNGLVTLTSPADLVGTPDWTTSTVYNAAGQVERTFDRYLAETIQTYDSRGNLVETRSESKDEFGVPVWIVTRVVPQEGRQLDDLAQHGDIVAAP